MLEVPVGTSKNGLTMEKESKVILKKNEPADRFHSTYILVYIVSGVIYFPITFFTTAADYWMYKFADRDASDDHRNYYQKSFLAVSGTVTEVCGAFIIVAPYLGKVLSFNVRMKICFFAVTILQLFILCMVGVDTDSWREVFYYICAASAGFLASTYIPIYYLIAMSFHIARNDKINNYLSTVIQAVTYMTVIEMVSKFPTYYMGLVDAGWGMSAVISALLQIISLEIGSSSKIVAFIYFGVAIFYICGAIITFYVITSKSSYYKYVMNRSVQTEDEKPKSVTLQKVLQITWKIKIPLIAQVIYRSSSSAITPGVTALVESEYKGNGSQWNDVFFTPVIAYLLYYTLCAVTRLIVFSLKKLPCNQYFLLVFTILKLGLIPLIMLCNAQPRTYLPVVFNHDYYFIIFVIIMGCSDSFCGTSLTMMMPAMVPGDEYTANVISAIAQTVVISCCSYLNILLVDSL